MMDLLKISNRNVFVSYKSCCPHFGDYFPDIDVAGLGLVFLHYF